jgi:hypothetical protein
LDFFMWRRKKHMVTRSRVYTGGWPRLTSS